MWSASLHDHLLRNVGVGRGKPHPSSNDDDDVVVLVVVVVDVDDQGVLAMITRMMRRMYHQGEDEDRPTLPLLLLQLLAHQSTLSCPHFYGGMRRHQKAYHWIVVPIVNE